MNRAYYSDTVSNFLHDDPDRILGILTANHQFALEDLQRNAWIEQIPILQQQLIFLKDGHILLEYAIPRMGKRVDAVLLAHGIVFVVELKVGEHHYASQALDQVLDYALDLKNFHEESHSRQIVPIVIATEAEAVVNTIYSSEDGVFSPLRTNKNNLGQALADVIASVSDSEPVLDPIAWRDSMYKPTPTIIEAAQALYRGHSVRDISRSDAGATNLSLTSQAISEIIDASKMTNQKAICFVTGVPGAGKTLAGLNIANEHLNINRDQYAVFLSGNGPLVTVLCEALARDGQGRSLANGKKQSKKTALSNARVFIQNVHHFRDDARTSDRPPVEKVAIFDEAQRAWTRQKTADFMKRRRSVQAFSMSEPEFLISIMDRHSDWAVIVCLIGSGQEINTGEAGLLEWLRAIRAHYSQWQVYYSPNLADDEFFAGETISDFVDSGHLKADPRLHLAVSIRSFRAESVSNLIKALLDNDLNMARMLCLTIGRQYPMAITRDAATAKDWLRSKARGTERYGLLAYSKANRLRSIGINVQAGVDVVNWFLSGKDDVRSSYYLEEVATEFDIQGLELDWACVFWDADLRYVNNSWTYQVFEGTNWRSIHAIARRQYLKNAYRVLLTRARQGMVIVVPEGNSEDKTRNCAFYDGTYNYLRQIGFEII